MLLVELLLLMLVLLLGIKKVLWKEKTVAALLIISYIMISVIYLLFKCCRVLRKPLPSALPRKHQPSRAFITKIHAIENLRKHLLYNQGVRYSEE